VFSKKKTLNSDFSLNLEKLSAAVAAAETGGCRFGYGATHNNCHGIKNFYTGEMIKFPDKKKSHAAFKKLWARKYKKFPNLRLAKIYTGNDRAKTWLKNVTNYYNN